MIANTVTDALFYTIHASKYLKMKEKGIDNRDPRITKMVAYLSD